MHSSDYKCERYEPKMEAMRELWNHELDANEKEAASVWETSHNCEVEMQGGMGHLCMESTFLFGVPAGPENSVETWDHIYWEVPPNNDEDTLDYLMRNNSKLPTTDDNINEHLKIPQLRYLQLEQLSGAEYCRVSASDNYARPIVDETKNGTRSPKKEIGDKIALKDQCEISNTASWHRIFVPCEWCRYPWSLDENTNKGPLQCAMAIAATAGFSVYDAGENNRTPSGPRKTVHARHRSPRCHGVTDSTRFMSGELGGTILLSALSLYPSSLDLKTKLQGVHPLLLSSPSCDPNIDGQMFLCAHNAQGLYGTFHPVTSVRLSLILAILILQLVDAVDVTSRGGLLIMALQTEEVTSSLAAAAGHRWLLAATAGHCLTASIIEAADFRQWPPGRSGPVISSRTISDAREPPETSEIRWDPSWLQSLAFDGIRRPPVASTDLPVLGSGCRHQPMPFTADQPVATSAHITDTHQISSPKGGVDNAVDKGGGNAVFDILMDFDPMCQCIDCAPRPPARHGSGWGWRKVADLAECWYCAYAVLEYLGRAHRQAQMALCRAVHYGWEEDSTGASLSSVERPPYGRRPRLSPHTTSSRSDLDSAPDLLDPSFLPPPTSSRRPWKL
ncbi:hypothetical protein DFH08DRAFT_813048 [Mycena albidolilacea]|uniref:Uncharacterized protein n=1 Tax=Mycena albidolilacea TaxID=1033008 RepID=A0AAD6ZTB3_9AGAR|nr:hypothetical protein DFH08DRAFT_813048 [Mycena albidolilacea]